MTETGSQDGTAVVRRYLDAVAAHDWEQAGECLSEEVRRVGPFGDVYEGREPYLAFLRDLMPQLAGYRMEIERLIAAREPATVVALLAETVEVDRKATVTSESLVFDLDVDGRIREIGIYIQQPT